MKKNVIILMVLLVFGMSFVFAGDFNINFEGNKIFTVATNASVLAQDISLTGWLVSVGNITTGEHFVGSGQFLTDIPSYNATYDSFITNVSTNWTEVVFDTWDSRWIDGNVSWNESYANTIYLMNNTYNETYHSFITNVSTNYTENTVTGYDTRWYQALWDATFNESFDDRSTVGDFTNIAYFNNSNTWAEDQEFSKGIIVNDYINLTTNGSMIASNSLTNITIDSSGNVNINLG